MREAAPLRQKKEKESRTESDFKPETTVSRDEARKGQRLGQLSEATADINNLGPESRFLNPASVG